MQHINKDDVTSDTQFLGINDDIQGGSIFSGIDANIQMPKALFLSPFS